MNGVDPVLELLDFPSREAVEVRSFRVPSPDEPVAVLDGAFLVGRVGPRVVGLRLEHAVESPLAQELAAVVGYQKFLIIDIIRNPALSGISDAA